MSAFCQVMAQASTIPESLHQLNLSFCMLPWSMMFYHSNRKSTMYLVSSSQFIIRDISGEDGCVVERPNVLEGSGPIREH